MSLCNRTVELVMFVFQKIWHQWSVMLTIINSIQNWGRGIYLQIWSFTNCSMFITKNLWYCCFCCWHNQWILRACKKTPSDICLSALSILSNSKDLYSALFFQHVVNGVARLRLSSPFYSPLSRRHAKNIPASIFQMFFWRSSPPFSFGPHETTYISDTLQYLNVILFI